MFCSKEFRKNYSFAIKICYVKPVCLILILVLINVFKGKIKGLKLEYKKIIFKKIYEK